MTAVALLTLAIAPPAFLLCQLAMTVRLVRRHADEHHRWLVVLPPYTTWAATRESGAGRAWAAGWTATVVLYVAAWLQLSTL